MLGWPVSTLFSFVPSLRPHAVKVFRFQVLSDCAALTMEFVDGGKAFSILLLLSGDVCIHYLTLEHRNQFKICNNYPVYTKWKAGWSIWFMSVHLSASSVYDHHLWWRNNSFKLNVLFWTRIWTSMRRQVCRFSGRWLWICSDHTCVERSEMIFFTLPTCLALKQNWKSFQTGNLVFLRTWWRTKTKGQLTDITCQTGWCHRYSVKWWDNPELIILSTFKPLWTFIGIELYIWMP